jgi:hypothetical protein
MNIMSNFAGRKRRSSEPGQVKEVPQFKKAIWLNDAAFGSEITFRRGVAGAEPYLPPTGEVHF